MQPNIYDRLNQDVQTNPLIRQHIIDSVVRSRDFQMFPAQLQNDRTLILETIRNDVSLYDVFAHEAFLDEEIRAECDETIVLPLQTFLEDLNYRHLPEWAKGNIPFLAKAIRTSSRGGLRIYQALPPEMQATSEIREVVVEHCIQEGPPFQEMPSELHEEIAVWQAAVQRNPLLYAELPPNLRENEQIALAALEAASSSGGIRGRADEFHVKMAVASYCPSITHSVLNDLDVMSVDVDLDLPDALQHIAPWIRDDGELMLRLCEFSGTSMEYASDRLKSCVSFIERLIQRAPDEEFMLFIPPEVFESNPQLVHRYLEEGCIERGAYKPDILMDALPKTMWTDRDIVMHYFRAAGEYFPLLGPTINDREICLAYIQGCTATYRTLTLSRLNLLPSWMHDDLKQSKQFVVEAAVLNPWIIYYASDEIKQDYYDILLVTVANHGVAPLRHFQILSRPDIGNHAMESKMDIDTVGFATKIIEKLQMHRAFVTAFLPGISSHHKPKSSVLTMLDFGIDHSIKMRIATYAGVPTGLELTYLRRALPAAENVKQDPEGVSYLANVDPYIRALLWNQASHRVL